jgi:hypothetical protein
VNLKKNCEEQSPRVQARPSRLHRQLAHVHLEPEDILWLRARALSHAWPQEAVYRLTRSMRVAIAEWDGGVRTELQIDAMSMELANEYAQSYVHAPSPFDWSFDPDDLVRRFQAGDALADLMSVGREHLPATDRRRQPDRRDSATARRAPSPSGIAPSRSGTFCSIRWCGANRTSVPRTRRQPTEVGSEWALRETIICGFERQESDEREHRYPPAARSA